MHRAAILILCIAAAPAAADPLPVDVATKAQPGDWTIFERTGDAPGHVLVRIGCPVQEKTAHVVWFGGEPGHERYTYAFVAPTDAPIDARLLPIDQPVAIKTEPARCKLAKDVACTKVTLTGDHTSVVMTMANEVRGSGIVELTATIGKESFRLRAIGYGRHGSSEWGVAAPTAALVEPTYDDTMVGGNDVSGIALHGTGPEPTGKAPAKLACPAPRKPDVAVANGGFGFGRSGFGPNPCGGGTIGSGYGGLRGRKVAVPRISIGQPTVSGGELDRAIIRRYIKRNVQKLQYCYEKALLAKPKLEGTVAATFEIAPDGTVTASVAKGIDSEVSECVAAVIKDIEFPKPRDGKPVSVVYPFTYRPAGT